MYFRQLTLIWKALCIHLCDSLSEGRGIHIKHFGCFTFEQSDSQVMKLRACFVVSPELKKHLLPMKDDLTHTNAGSIYQQGIRVSYLNPVPIAAGCYFSSNFVKNTLDVLFKGVLDLIMRGYNLDLDFEGAVNIRIFDKRVRTRFSPLIADRANIISASWPLKCINASLTCISQSTAGKTSISPVHAIKTNQRVPSNLDTLQVPDATRLKDMKTKIHKLTEGSKDFANISLID